MTTVLTIAVGNMDLMQFLICFHQQIMPQNTNIELQCKRKAGGRGKHKHLSNTNLRRERECEKKINFFLYLLHPSGRVSKSTVFTNHNLISVRHRKYRLIILLYLHVISCSSTWNFASSRDPELRPSLESSIHSGFDLMAASIVESDLVFS